MPKYSVDVKCFINVGVEAANEEEAREIAEGWVEWLSPTEEQLAGYVYDHDVIITEGGTLSIDGDSEVEFD